MYHVSDEDIQKVNVVQAQTEYMLVYEEEGMRNHKTIHPHFDNSAPLFDKSKHSTTLISPYHYKVSDVNSTTSAQSDPTAQFVSFFEMMTFCGNFTAWAVAIYLQTITLVIINLYKMMEEQRRHLEKMASKTKSTMAEEDLPKNYSMKSLRRFHLTK